MSKPEGHVVLYRKYRSRSFDEVVGQDNIVNPLKQSIASGRIAHAYLFTGPRGTGKTSIARIFANAINGFEYGDQLPIDIIEIDGASNRRIDEIRELKERIHTSPVQAKYKVYIIDEVHMLTKEAFNALLKTLEEPPEHAVFILATTEAHKLPATIISRTQRYTFRLVSPEVVKEHLAYICKQEGFKYEDSALLTIAKMGQGSFRDSISLLDQVSSVGDITEANVSSTLGTVDSKSMSELLAAVRSATPKEIVQKLQELLLSGSSSTQIAKQLIEVLREQNDITETWLELISSLIEVNASIQPEISLEVALLSANLKLNPNAKLEVQAVAAKQPETISAPVMPAPKPAIKAPVAEKQAEVAPGTAKLPEKPAPKKGPLKELDENTWTEILMLIKAKNNALYSILRMATAQFEQDELVLSFQFEFHQKQVESSKTILIDAANEIIGQGINLRTVVDKKAAKPKPDEVEEIIPVAEPVTTEAKSVLEAFGGGEVVKI